jgi:UDP-N-acetylmuramate dehydrogenase
MPKLYKDYPLDNLNTFGVRASAKYFVKPKSLSELVESVKKIIPKDLPLMVLGGGSNVLFTKDFNGVILQPSLSGIEEIHSDEDFATLSVGAGETWDDFVEYAVNNGLCGIENLSLIPGSVGASPIQNIGAYGVEVKDSIEMVMGLNLESMEMVEYSKNECQFDYRNSIFKNELKEKVIITHVYFKLSKHFTPITHYGNLEDELKTIGDKTLKNIRKAVVNIRNSKLPDPAKLGNAGSFFKNPIVHLNIVSELKKLFDKVPFYPVNDDSVKLPAGWLIEQCGWKGKRIGNVGVHQNQALVLVNYGEAKGDEILSLAEMVSESVFKNFNVSLEMEVNIV